MCIMVGASICRHRDPGLLPLCSGPWRRMSPGRSAATPQQTAYGSPSSRCAAPPLPAAAPAGCNRPAAQPSLSGGGASAAARHLTPMRHKQQHFDRQWNEILHTSPLNCGSAGGDSACRQRPRGRKGAQPDGHAQPAGELRHRHQPLHGGAAGARDSLPQPADGAVAAGVRLEYPELQCRLRTCSATSGSRAQWAAQCVLRCRVQAPGLRFVIVQHSLGCICGLSTSRRTTVGITKQCLTAIIQMFCTVLCASDCNKAQQTAMVRLSIFSVQAAPGVQTCRCSDVGVPSVTTGGQHGQPGVHRALLALRQRLCWCAAACLISLSSTASRDTAPADGAPDAGLWRAVILTTDGIPCTCHIDTSGLQSQLHLLPV